MKKKFIVVDLKDWSKWCLALAAIVVALLLFSCKEAVANPLMVQQCKPYDTAVGSGYFVMMNNNLMTSHTSERTAIRRGKEFLEADPSAAIQVGSNIRIHWRPEDCGIVEPVEPDPTPTPEPEPEPEPDPIPEPDPTPPDTTPTPEPEPEPDPEEVPLVTDSTIVSPTNVSLYGYAGPTMINVEYNGLIVTWDAVGADSFRVYGGMNAGDNDNWQVILPGDVREYKKLLTYTEVTPIWACVTKIMFISESVQQCDGFNWPPMVQGE